MPANKGTLPVDEVAILSKALRARYKALKASGASPEQCEELIPEPAGEPGRSPTSLDKNGKPRGYQLHVALGLKKTSSMHSQYRNTLKDNAVGIIWGRPYGGQRRNNVTLTVSAALKRHPIFHCYEDNWPLHAYLKRLLTTSSDSKRKLQKKVLAEEAEEDDGDSDDNERDKEDVAGSAVLNSTAANRPNPTHVHDNNGGNPNVPVMRPSGDRVHRPVNDQVAQTAAEAAHGRVEDFAPDSSEPPSDLEPEQTLAKPPATTKRHRQGDSDRNLPGNQNARAKKLKPNLPGITLTGQEQDTGAPPKTRPNTRRGVTGSSSAAGAPEAGPGPNTMARQKELARRKGAAVAAKAKKA